MGNLRSIRGISSALCLLALLAACGEPEVILPGERLDLRDGMAGQQVSFANTAAPIALPAQVANADWTHRNGGPDHRITHPALPGTLSPAFSVGIGEGDSRRARITADPVVAGGRIFTLDARSGVQATSTGGQVLWTRDITPELAGPNDASGGGISTDGRTVFVTTGFGRLTALDAATGAVRWVQELDAPGATPTVRGGLVYVVVRNSRALAIEADTGRIRWEFSAIPSLAGFAGGAGPATDGETVYFPIPSGEVVAVFAQGGLQRWSSVVAGTRPGFAGGLAATDISGDPVIDGGRLYVGNVSGRLAAIDRASGERIWTATEGAVSPVWPVGGSVFLVNDVNELVRIDANTGLPLWRVTLPGFVETRERRMRTRYAHYGPVLAGGRLIVASGDGVIRQFDPVSGALLGELPLPGGAASNPVVAGGALYVVSQSGQLVAFR
ncbi:MAG: PQQ-binding-like beta-propeller repeat protein [Rubellimicrobium sp.]|nr:PQQ-binding-like beta-propeller repeat protein [Rubellimicrobium sp.]